jgi:nucleoside-diphosphate-sugar epimerase
VGNDPPTLFERSTRCFVTGAGGFLGGELVRTALRQGMSPDRVRCLVRRPEAAVAQGIPETSLVVGDLGDEAALAKGLDGVDVVFHLAGTIKGSRPSDFLPVNQRATQTLAAAIMRHAPAAFVVHVSSLAAAGPSMDGVGSDAEPDRCQPVSAYGESKRLGEIAMRECARRVAVIRPPVVYGAGDSATRLLFRSALAPLCFAPPSPRPLSVVHVRDAVAAMLLVATTQPVGATLPLDGPDRTDMHDLLRAIAESCGRRARLVAMPLAIAGAAAWACDGWSRITGRPLHFNRDKVRELRARGWVADGEALRRLGLKPQMWLREGLREVAVAEGFAR